MKKLYFLDEEEKNRILNIHEGATKRQYLNEAESTDLSISKLFYDEGARYGGTDPDSMVKAIEMITSPEQFWRVNTMVKTRPGNDDKLDIAGVINDEFEYDAQEAQENKGDLDKIRNWLKTKLGITSTIQGNGSGSYVDGTFKITSKPVDDVSPKSTNMLTNWSDCVKQYGGTLKASQSDSNWVYVEVNKTDDAFFKNDYSFQYQKNGKTAPTDYGTWACNGDKLTITMKGGNSYVNGKWTGVPNSSNKGSVDPKKAYQERAKQVNQQTTDTTKQIQQALGQDPTGNLDALYIDKVIDLLKQ